MDYDEIELAARKISYPDKLRLAQLMIQLARREEEEANPARRKPSEPSLADYAAPRLDGRGDTVNADRTDGREAPGACRREDEILKQAAAAPRQERV